VIWNVTAGTASGRAPPTPPSDKIAKTPANERQEFTGTAYPAKKLKCQRFVKKETQDQCSTAQGELSRDLFLVGKGRVSALLKAHNGEVIRLRTLGPGSMVGEIGMYLGRPRTASIVTETESIVWRLPSESLAGMEREDPRCAAALHEILARMLASRLTQANELLEISLR